MGTEFGSMDCEPAKVERKSVMRVTTLIEGIVYGEDPMEALSRGSKFLDKE